MDTIKEFVKPELLVLIPVIYIIGMGLKKSEVKDKHIPWTLGGTGVILAAMWVIGTSGFSPVALFTAVTQGIICAGASVYVNQLVKQSQKSEG